MIILKRRRGQASEKAGGELVRAGFTASRRSLGKAVVRNRARRRLKELARLHLAALGEKNCDYVFIARQHAPSVAAKVLSGQFIAALRKLARRC